MALLPVHVRLMNGLDEVRAHQGEIGADAVRRLEVDAVIDTRYLAGPTDLRDEAPDPLRTRTRADAAAPTNVGG